MKGILFARAAVAVGSSGAPARAQRFGAMQRKVIARAERVLDRM